MIWRQTILGEPASKSNSSERAPRWSKKKQRVYMAQIKSEKAQGYMSDFLKQCRRPPKPFECDVSLVAFIFYASRRPDLDESLIMDCLQKAEVVKNDRQIKEKHIYWGLDRENPRAELMVEPKA